MTPLGRVQVVIDGVAAALSWHFIPETLGRQPPQGTARARSHCRFVLPLIHFIPDSLTYSVPLYLKRQCDRTLGTAGGIFPADPQEICGPDGGARFGCAMVMRPFAEMRRRSACRRTASPLAEAIEVAIARWRGG
jgi:hypothetical protein